MDIPPEILESHTDQSVSSVHHVLRSSRRRLAIILIAHHILTVTSPDASMGDASQRDDDTYIQVRTVAREITAIEEGIPIQEATGEEYRNVYTSLIQTHLPRLNDTNVIRYDPDRKTIAYDENLLAFSVITAITSPVAQMLLHDAVAELYTERGGFVDSIGD